MRMNQKLSLVLVAFFLCLTGRHSSAQQSAKGKAAADATTALLQLNSNYQQAGAVQKSQLLTQFQTLAAQRQQLLSSLIQTDHGDVLRVAIPGSISQTMPTTVQNFVEKDTIAQGTLEVAVEMNGTPDKTTGTKMHYGLTVAEGKLAL